MKFLKWLVIVLVAIPVLFVTRSFIRNKMVGPEGWAMDNTEKRLRAKMRDPDSMVIRSSFTVSVKNGNETTIAICGIVDGRNGFGGYTGGTRFVSLSVSRSDTFDTNTVEMEDPEQKKVAESVHRLSAFETVYWNDSCVDAGHPALIAEK